MEGSSEQGGSFKDDEIKIDVKIRNILRKECLATSKFTGAIEASGLEEIRWVTCLKCLCTSMSK